MKKRLLFFIAPTSETFRSWTAGLFGRFITAKKHCKRNNKKTICTCRSGPGLKARTTLPGLGASALSAVAALYLEGQSVCNTGASALGAALDRGALPCLRILDLNNTAIFDEGLVALALALRRRPSRPRWNGSFSGRTLLATRALPPSCRRRRQQMCRRRWRGCCQSSRCSTSVAPMSPTTAVQSPPLRWKGAGCRPSRASICTALRPVARPRRGYDLTYGAGAAEMVGSVRDQLSLSECSSGARVVHSDNNQQLRQARFAVAVQ